MTHTLLAEFQTLYPHPVRVRVVDPLLHPQSSLDPAIRHPLHSGVYEVHGGAAAVAEVLIQRTQACTDLSLLNGYSIRKGAETVI